MNNQFNHRLTRREFLQRAAMLGLSASAVALLDGCGILPGSTPMPTKVFRIGVISGGTRDAAVTQRIEALRQGLRELGYVEGENINIEYRFAEGRAERFPDLVAQLITLKVDVLVVVGSSLALVAKQATSTIPIVFVQAPDPVGIGLVASLAHPGGNATGLGSGFNLTGKQLQLLKDAIPTISRVAYFWEGQFTDTREAQDAARALGLQLQALLISSPDDIEGAIQAAIRERADALLVYGGPRMGSRRPQFMELVAKSRMPAIFNLRDYVDLGGLMFYGQNLLNDWYRTATYVDKILKGAKPADLPVENPTKFDFVINLKTAKELGLTIPQSVLTQATEVIQ